MHATNRVCVAAAAPDFRPAASGRFCRTTASRAISSATATRPSPARSKITCCSRRRRTQIIEGILLGSYAIGCHHAFIYIRGEFKRGYEIFCEAVEEARARRLHRQRHLRHRLRSRVTVHRGAGAYICGEETGLLNSLEGKRGEPRLKPPFPAVKGLYGEPTVVNNVETLAYLVPILRNGPEWFAAVGTERSQRLQDRLDLGPRARNRATTKFRSARRCASSSMIAPAVCATGRKFLAVQPGGGSSACLFEEHLDSPYDYETMAKAGSMLGSGAMVVFDDTTDFVKAALQPRAFLRARIVRTVHAVP